MRHPTEAEIIALRQTIVRQAHQLSAMSVEITRLEQALAAREMSSQQVEGRLTRLLVEVSELTGRLVRLGYSNRAGNSEILPNRARDPNPDGR